MSSFQSTKRDGYLFIAAGRMFFLAAYLGKQVTLCGFGVAFLATGTSYLAWTKRAWPL